MWTLDAFCLFLLFRMYEQICEASENMSVADPNKGRPQTCLGMPRADIQILALKSIDMLCRR